ncbi:enoyl-CoA hydratase/isomerase family protein [Bradyrhizobium sp. LHD-71]|uniref:enoyl-CoA hydratase/isomerase family protein n=1 Tax=Bradyrhizobium sp. LHD-71 TaxID=3072141 RepID=UPI00280D3D73|nr:enoyl-CoA hydratase/isomerase family protein [Bradyrhizobium sp. LHD-71]MDQ8731493.1 enoyl-CoA hydratase/isomerase family protein [Bradyrhizobium sp. LHD-71]
MSVAKAAAKVDQAVEATPPLFSIKEGTATIRLNRPAVANRLEPDDVAALSDLFDRIEKDPAIRLLVLTGTGRIFSSGYHLGDLQDRASAQQTPASPAPRNMAFEDMVNRLENLRVPTICRLNGGVYGGATDLALACDFRIGDATAQMFMPAARLGLHYYESGMVRYVTRLGVNAAKLLFLTARRIDAQEMFRIGYLTSLCEAGRLDATVDELIKDLASMAPLSVAGMKRAINEIARHELDRKAFEERAQACFQSDDIKEGLRAFHEKRPPRFSGR